MEANSCLKQSQFKFELQVLFFYSQRNQWKKIGSRIERLPPSSPYIPIPLARYHQPPPLRIDSRPIRYALAERSRLITAPPFLPPFPSPPYHRCKMLSDLLWEERKWKGPCKLGVQFSIRSFGIYPLDLTWSTSIPFALASLPSPGGSPLPHPIPLFSSVLSVRSAYPSPPPPPPFLRRRPLRADHQSSLSICNGDSLCPSRESGPDTPAHHALSSLLPSSRPPSHSARRSISAPLYIWPTRRGGWGMERRRFLSVSLPPPSLLSIPLSLPPRRWLDTSPLVNVPAATDGISVDGEKEKEPPPPHPLVVVVVVSNVRSLHTHTHAHSRCLVVHLVVR